MLVHSPVLLREVLTFLDLHPGDHTVDATVGAGGHAREILDRTSPDGRILGIDIDSQALKIAQQNLQEFSPRIILAKNSFDNLTHILNEYHFPQPAAILADLGLSSVTLGDSSRGFSFQVNSPLDMRFDPLGGGRTAAEIINTFSPAELERIFREYGEDRNAARIARSIINKRKQKPITTTGELVEVILQATRRRGRIHPATKTFQALRIAVNDELGRLQRFLPQAVNALTPGGRLAVISFHSLEDRIVKQFFRKLKADGRAQILTKHPATPSFAEVTTNPRSRSAKLRVAVRINNIRAKL